MARSSSRASLLVAFVLGVAALTSAVAAGEKSLDDVLAKRGAEPAILVVAGAADGAEARTAARLLADKRLARAKKEGIAEARIDLADEASFAKLGIASVKSDTLVVLDGYGVVVEKLDGAPSADALARPIEQAQKLTTKKRATEKKLAAALKVAEAALAKGDTKTAVVQCQGIAQAGAEVPCPTVDAAKNHLEELTRRGLAACEEVQKLVDDGAYPKAHAELAKVLAAYPIPEVEAAAKTVREELAQAESE